MGCDLTYDYVKINLAITGLEGREDGRDIQRSKGGNAPEALLIYTALQRLDGSCIEYGGNAMINPELKDSIYAGCRNNTQVRRKNHASARQPAKDKRLTLERQRMNIKAPSLTAQGRPTSRH